MPLVELGEYYCTSEIHHIFASLRFMRKLSAVSGISAAAWMLLVVLTLSASKLDTERVGDAHTVVYRGSQANTCLQASKRGMF